MRIRCYNLVEPVVPLFQELARTLCDQGHDFEALVSRLDYREGRPALEERLDSRATVHYLGGRGRLRGQRLHRVEMNLRYLLGVVVAVLTGPRGAINIVLSQPPGVQAVVVLLGRLRMQCTVVHVMDVYPDVLVAAGSLAENSWVRRIWSAVMAASMRRADAVVAIGTCMVDRLVASGAPRERVYVVRNWTREISPPDASVLRRRRREIIGDRDIFIVGYAGNMGVAHDFDALVEAAERLESRGTPVHFLLSGDGARRREVDDAVHRRGLTNVTVRGFVPEDELDVWLSVPHIHLVSLRPEFSGLVVPSKTYGALGAARPVLYAGDPWTDVAADLLRTGSGIVTTDADDLERALVRLIEDPDEYRQMVEAAVNLAGERDAASAMRSYWGLIADISRGR